MAKTVIFGDGSTENELWSHLSESGKPIIIYGMGNGADKIIAVLEERGMRAADFFASDGFVRGQLFHGKRVLSLSEVKEKYTDFIILVAFGSHLPEVCGAIRRLDEQYELYAPDVPVAGEELFDADYYEANKVRFECARALLADEHSRFVFDCVIKYKLSGKISCLAACESEHARRRHDVGPGYQSRRRSLEERRHQSGRPEFDHRLHLDAGPGLAVDGLQSTGQPPCGQCRCL